MKELFKKSTAVKFYRFDPLKQPSVGLDIAAADGLHIAVFPAGGAPMVAVQPKDRLELLLAGVAPRLRSHLSRDSYKQIRRVLPNFEVQDATSVL
jgi:hypothetical protein